MPETAEEDEGKAVAPGSAAAVKEERGWGIGLGDEESEEEEEEEEGFAPSGELVGDPVVEAAATGLRRRVAVAPR